MESISYVFRVTINDDERDFNVYALVDPAESEDDRAKILITKIMWEELGDPIDVTAIFATMPDTLKRMKDEGRWIWNDMQQNAVHVSQFE